MYLTEADSGIFLSYVVTLLVGKEHVCRETTLGRVGVYGAPVRSGLKFRRLEARTLLFLASSIGNLGLGLTGSLLLRHYDGDLMILRVSRRVN